MDAARALADLTEISSQIEAVVLADAGGAVLGTTLADERLAARFAADARRLLDEGRSAGHREDAELTQVEAATPEGSLFVVRDGGRTIAATTGPEPTVGLVFYDLKSCLRSLDEPAAGAPAAEQATPKPKRAPRRKAEKAPEEPKEPADGEA